MKVIHGRTEGNASELRGPNFTGAVWADPVMPTTDGVTINSVFFTPGGRTHWHAHQTGQILQVTSGRGWVCKDGEAPQEIRTGDTVWIAPGERHWHGAAEDSFMSHTAITIGATHWAAPVTPEDYASR